MLALEERKARCTPPSAGSAELEPVMGNLNRKNAYTYNHCARVGSLASSFAETLGLACADRHLLARGCYLHDVGKLLIPNSVLLQEGELSRQEWMVMKQHPRQGAELAAALFAGLEKEVLEVIMHHHERWDGNGYPQGLSGVNIPYFARICAVLDAYDSMRFDRCYRRGRSYAQTREELVRSSVTQFDPDIVHAFVAFTDGLQEHTDSVQAC